jgi:hypothetical protein
VHGLADLDALLELRLLQLDADPTAAAVDVAERDRAPSTSIEPRSGRPQPFDALHRRRLAGAVGTDEPKISPSRTSNDTSSHSDSRSVRFPEPRDFEYG